MPTPATDRRRIALFALAAVAVALALVASRAVNGVAAVVARPLPAADLQGLNAFMNPLPDSASLAGVATGTMVVASDPFGSPPPTQGAVVRKDVPAPKVASGRWVVSSILFEDAKRSAIVNNAWVNVGDPLEGGARVSAIERKHVVVTDANGTRHVVPIQGGVQ
jgi:hypothetical protein